MRAGRYVAESVKLAPGLIPAGILLLAVALVFSPGAANNHPQNFTLAVGPPELGTLRAAAESTPNVLRLVSFNVHYAREPVKLAESIRANPQLARADVFLLQEIEAYAQEGSSRTRRLAEALELNYVYAPARTTPEGGTHGLAILSRFPIRDVEIIRLKQFNLGYHTRQRIALAATLQVGQADLRVYNLHLDTRINPGDRLEQLRPVVAQAHAHPIPRLVIAGDFNTNPFRWLGHVLPFHFPIFRANQAKAVHKFMAAHSLETRLSKAGPTSRKGPLGLLRARLDSIYTRGLEVRNFGVERSVKVSDHSPVWIDVAWPPLKKPGPAP